MHLTTSPNDPSPLQDQSTRTEQQNPPRPALGTVARCSVFVYRPGLAVRSLCPGYHTKLTPLLGQRSAPPMQVHHSLVFPNKSILVSRRASHRRSGTWTFSRKCLREVGLFISPFPLPFFAGSCPKKHLSSCEHDPFEVQDKQLLPLSSLFLE